MATNDVPGYKDENDDELHIGCWAEHDDGSYIFVQGMENNNVIYSMFDTKVGKEYRDAMPEVSFKKTFSWDGNNDKWTWHDKRSVPGPVWTGAWPVCDCFYSLILDRSATESGCLA